MEILGYGHDIYFKRRYWGFKYQGGQTYVQNFGDNLIIFENKVYKTNNNQMKVVG